MFVYKINVGVFFNKVFQWDAYRPLVDRFPKARGGESAYPMALWEGRGPSTL